MDNNAPQPPPAPPMPPMPRWRLGRLIKIIALSILTLILIAAIATFFYIRSGRLNRYIARAVISALADNGVRAEIGGLELSWRDRVAKLRDIKLYNLATGQPIATIDHADLLVEILHPYAVSLNREIILKQLDLDGVKFYVAIDKHGQTNFHGIHSVTRAPGRITFDTSSLRVALIDGKLQIDDRQHNVAGNLNKLRASIEPGGQPRTVNAQLFSDGGLINYRDRSADIENVKLTANISDNGANLTSLAIRAPIGQANISGRIVDWQALRYNLSAQAKIDLEKAAPFFAPEKEIGGVANFDGYIAGEGADYQIGGNLDANELAWNNARGRNLRFNGIKIRPEKDKLLFFAKQSRIEAIEVAGANISGLSIVAGQAISSEKGITLTAPQIAIDRVALTRGDLFSGVNLRNADAAARDGAYQLRADLYVASSQLRGVKIDQTTGQLIARNDQILLNQFKAALLGGAANGDLALEIKGESHLKVNFAALQTNALFALAAIKRNDLTGRVNGQAQLSWPGMNIGNVSGAVNAQFHGQTTADAIPLNGDLAIKARDGAINVDHLKLFTDATTLTANGVIALKGNSDLHFSIVSTDAQQLQTIAASLGIAKEEINRAQLQGAFSFAGRFSGTLSNATLEGDLNAENVGWDGEKLGHLIGHLRYSPTEINFENASLQTVNGGSTKFGYVSSSANGGRLDAVFDRIDAKILTTLLPAPLRLMSGEITGAAHLNGLPDRPQGTIDFSLTNGAIAGQRAEKAEASIIINGETAQLQRVEIKLPQGHIIAAGNLDVKSGDFQIHGNADQIDLSRLAGAANLKAAVTGAANADFNVQGNLHALSKLNLQLSAQGENVVVNGHAADLLKLTATTDNNGRVNISFNTEILGHRQEIRAIVDLRAAGLPVNIESDLIDFDIAPAIDLFAPALADKVSGRVSGTLRLNGPLINDEGIISLNNFLHGNLQLTKVSLQAGKQPINVATPITVAFNGSQLRVEPTRFYAEGIDLDLAGLLSLRRNSRLDFSIKGNADLSKLGSLSSYVYMNGVVTIDAKLTGTLAQPSLTGELRVRDLSLSAPDLPVTIEQGAGVIAFSNDKAVVQSFTAKANGGNVQASGMIKLSSLQVSDMRFNIIINDIDVYLSGLHAIVNSNLTLSGPLGSPILSGSAKVAQAEYSIELEKTANGNLNFSNFNISNWFGIGGGVGIFSALRLDIHIDAPDNVLIRNQAVKTVASAKLMISGTLGTPDLTGRVVLDGGTIKFRGHRYDITTGTLDLPGDNLLPIVNLVAEGNVHGYHVYVGLNGPIDKLDLILRTDPDLTRAEIISLITTGRVENSSLSNGQIMNTEIAALLTGEILSQPLGRGAQEYLGITTLQLDPLLRPNTNPAARITVGKQITHDLLFTYSTSLAYEQDQTAILEYYYSSRYSIVGAYSQGGTTALGFRTDSDLSLEFRGRKRFSFNPEHDRLALADTNSNGNQLPNFSSQKLPRANVIIDRPAGFTLSEKSMRNQLPIVESGFSRPLARLGETNLANYMQEKGYFFASAHSQCQPIDCDGANPTVHYIIDPGPRLYLREIRIEGSDAVKWQDVKDELESQKASFLGDIPVFTALNLIGGSAHGITSEDRLRHDREVIRQHLVNLGYRSARVTSGFAVMPNRRDLILVFHVDEGARSIIDEIVFRGNCAFTDQELRSLVKIKDCEFFSLAKLQDALQKIRNHYTDCGYLDVRIALNVEEPADNRARVVYTLEEGAQAIVREIQIEGEIATKESAIRRFFEFKIGEPLTADKIYRTQHQLYATGSFREVSIRNEAIGGADATARRVIVKVTESKPFLVVYGSGYSTDNGVTGLLEFTDSNLFGRIDTGSIRARVSQREQYGQAQYTDLRTFGSHWATTFSAFYDRNSNLQSFAPEQLVNGQIETGPSRSFGIDRLAAFIQAERKFNQHTSLRVRYNFENDKLFNTENIPLIEIPSNDQAILLGMLTIGMTYDDRDSALDPTKGQLVSGDQSLAARALGGNVSYNKFFGEYQRYQKLKFFNNTIFAFATKIGLAAPFQLTDSNGDGVISGPERELPISQRFFSGGATTLRGFDFNDAGPQGILEPRNSNELPTLVPLGGDALVIFNFELRYPLTERLRLVPFYDLGNVFRLVSKINFSKMTNTVGLGLRFKTPIGPIGVDYGYLLDPPAFVTASGGVLRQPHGHFHIRFGQSF